MFRQLRSDDFIRVFFSFSLSLSRSICLSPPAMINRDTRVVSVVVFAEAPQRRAPAREKRLSFHGNAVTLWYLSALQAVADV